MNVCTLGQEKCAFFGCVAHLSSPAHPKHAHWESLSCDGVISRPHTYKMLPLFKSAKIEVGRMIVFFFSLNWPSLVPPSTSSGWILRCVRMLRSAVWNNHQDWLPASMWYHQRTTDVCITLVYLIKDITKRIFAISCWSHHEMSSFWINIIDRLVREILEVPLVGLEDHRTFSHPTWSWQGLRFGRGAQAHIDQIKFRLIFQD